MPELANPKNELIAQRIRTQLPRRFEGTVHWVDDTEHRFLSLVIEKLWMDKDNTEKLRLTGSFRRMGVPAFGKGFLTVETRIIGMIFLRVFLLQVLQL